MGNPPRDNHQIRLPRRGTKDLGPKSCNIESRSPHRHHLDCAARQSKSHGPNGILPNPIHCKIERSEKHALRLFITVAHFLQLDAVVRTALQCAEKVVVPLCCTRHSSNISSIPRRGYGHICSLGRFKFSVCNTRFQIPVPEQSYRAQPAWHCTSISYLSDPRWFCFLASTKPWASESLPRMKPQASISPSTTKEATT